jgi:signal transduction histidine kinase
VFANLISNSSKHRSGGRIEVTVRRVALRRRVVRYGHRIPRESLDTVFDMLAVQARKRRPVASGSASLVRSLVQMHGSVEAQSEGPGEGTRSRFACRFCRCPLLSKRLRSNGRSHHGVRKRRI